MTLDTELYGEREEDAEEVKKNPVEQQIDLLSTALGATKQ